ncbi:hypothetical protein SAMN04487950_3872 [Halogranum rubrum]|uniref:Uncharacterized protein n=1 Tax=Halogranum rubrum TaxID=553466 RepID=A0A1I4HXD4_9EURY|nr:hypothetical protein SAMN04487950_3872 [Halogranum rubrum]
MSNRDAEVQAYAMYGIFLSRGQCYAILGFAVTPRSLAFLRILANRNRRLA